MNQVFPAFSLDYDNSSTFNPQISQITRITLIT
jgi:hypothetical protein